MAVFLQKIGKTGEVQEYSDPSWPAMPLEVHRAKLEESGNGPLRGPNQEWHQSPPNVPNQGMEKARGCKGQF